MAANEEKITIDNLKAGMFVSRLEIPWLDTPFLLEGMPIKTQEDVDLLRPYTTYVFVDVDKGSAPPPEHILPLTATSKPKPVVTQSSAELRREYESVRKVTYEDQTDFEEEFVEAREIRGRIKDDLKRVVQRLHNEDSLSIESLESGIQDSVESVIRNPSAFSLLAQLEKTDNYTYSHALSTSIWCAQFGRHLGMERAEIEDLALGGMLLDIGKIKLPQKLFELPRGLIAREKELANQHVDKGLRLLAKTKSVPTTVMRMVATHHERANGSGYPAGMSNEEIPIVGRIAGIIDSYDAMTTPTPYRQKHMSANQAINELYKERGILFDTELVEQFIQTVGMFPSGSLVELNSGAVAIVLEVNPHQKLFPKVMLLLDPEKQPLDGIEIVDLAGDKERGLAVNKALPHGAYDINIEELFLDA
jgi:HD-GYP domain-containing protein (c-di-GMP phosphodiesterase class II)